jgi:hypothetical protein
MEPQMNTDQNWFHLCSSVPHLWQLNPFLRVSFVPLREKIFSVSDSPLNDNR